MPAILISKEAGMFLRRYTRTVAGKRLTYYALVESVRTADGRDLRARYVLCADGAHSIFSTDPRPKRSISTLMGWWDGADFTPQQIEMIFDRNVAPLYGWLFPESDRRVNIGICIDGQDANGQKTQRNVQLTLTLLCPLLFAAFGIFRWRQRESGRAAISLD